MIKCLICNKEYNNRTGFCNHINRKHGLTKKDYYDKYIKQDGEGICKYKDCTNNTTFFDIENGYADCCCLEHTNLYRYGVICNLNITEVKEKAQKNSHTDAAIQKGLNKRIERYNGSGYSSKVIYEKIKKTNLERYNTDNPWKSKKVREKCKQTKLERYNDENFNNREKAKQTYLKKYGKNHPVKTEQIKEKQRQTCKKRYGKDYYLSTQDFKDKSKKTCQDKYGTDYWVQSKEYGQSKSKNFTTIEAYFAKLLEKSNIDYIHEYKNDKYPYFCDFYLPETDTYVELHNYWMHQDHFYDKDSIEDQKLLTRLQEKAKEKSIYRRAIQIWTISDIEKLECAKKNKLNYVVLRNKEDINSWIKDYTKEI